MIRACRYEIVVVLQHRQLNGQRQCCVTCPVLHLQVTFTLTVHALSEVSISGFLPLSGTY